MYGRPRALSETFAAYNPKPTVEDARWVINYELVRGINLFEFMFWPASAGGGNGPSGYLSDSLFPTVAEYSNRSSFLLSNGKPAAQIGLYMPTESMWLGNEDVNTSLLHIEKQLSEKQLDYDLVDEQGISSVFSLQNGTFKNLSGQTYSAIIIPSLTILNEKVLSRLQEFKKSGGTVIFLGTLPSLMSGRTFLDAKNPASLSWADHYVNDSLTADVIIKLPADVLLDGIYPSVKYLHREWKDAKFYFLFNEGNENIKTHATLNGNGKAEIWDPATAIILPVESTITGKDKINVALELNAHETKFIVIKK
jgi:hypothetical protein